MDRKQRYVRSIRADFNWSRVVEIAKTEGTCGLGSIFALTPSGKFYAPFACSNVAGCARCKGTGEVRRSAGNADKHARLEAEIVSYRLSMISAYGYYAAGNWPRADLASIQAIEAAARAVAPTKTCEWCNGLGSHEAAKDIDWHAALELVASEHGLYVGRPDDYADDVIFVSDPNYSEEIE